MYHNSEGGTPLRDNLVSLVREVGNANERRGIGGHRGGATRGGPGYYSRQLGGWILENRIETNWRAQVDAVGVVVI